MSRAELSSAELRKALRAIRFGKPLDDSPLFQLASVRERLRKQGAEEGANQRRWALSRLLDDVIWSAQNRLRGSDRAMARAQLTPEAELAQLRRDFEVGNLDLEAWSMLHQRYFGRSNIEMKELAARIGVSRKTLSRRLARGDQLLVEALNVRERDAEASTVRRHNLPRPRTRFIGREREIAAVRALMVEHRIVTLTGPGGIGKSRLALRIAEDLAADYPQGVRFVDLSPARRAEQVGQAFAAALGVQAQAGGSLEDTLAEHLADRRMLLLVDNCEHLVDPSSALIDALLRRCPSLQLLATSRESLDVAGVATWDVPPLSLPSSPRDLNAAAPMHYDALRLFRDRASQALDDAPSEARAARIGRICARLDGIPLAIELAAARTPQLSLEQILERLDDRFALLQGGGRTMRAMHQTLQATMDWSWQQLSGQERMLLRRAAVFRGGWTLEAAETVCAGEGLPAEAMRSLLAQLAAKSLIVVHTERDAVRYGMLETVRAYGAHRLASDRRQDAVRARHARFFLDVAQKAQPRLRGPRSAEWLERLRVEDANLMAAMEGAVARGDARLGLSLGAALFLYWQIRGLQSQGRGALAGALALPEVNRHPAEYASALWVAGLLADDQGEASLALFEKCHSVAQGLGDPLRIARVKAQIARQSAKDGAGSVAAAREQLREAVEVSQAMGRPFERADALKALATFHVYRGEIDAAAARYAEQMAVAEASSDRYGEISALIGLGYVQGRMGDYDAAANSLQRLIGLAEAMGHKKFLAFGLLNLGDVHLRRGDLEAARAMYRRSRTLFDDFGGRSGVALCEIHLGEIALRRGDHPRARVWLESALRLLGRLHGSPDVTTGHRAVALSRWAKYEALEGRYARCLVISAAVKAWFAATPTAHLGSIADGDDAILSAARAALGRRAADRASAEGWRLTLEEAAAYALGEAG